MCIDQSEASIITCTAASACSRTQVSPLQQESALALSETHQTHSATGLAHGEDDPVPGPHISTPDNTELSLAAENNYLASDWSITHLTY